MLIATMVPRSQLRLTRQPRAAGRWLGLVASIALVLAALIALQTTPSAAQDPDARLFAAHVLDLRAAGVTGDERAVDFLASLPGSGIVDAESLPILWPPFFANAIVKLGRLHSLGPAALYYDPLLDVALFTLWEREGEGYVVASARTLLGDRLANPAAAATVQPPWMTAEENPLDALVRIASERLDTFRRLHPAEAREAGRTTTTFAAASADMRAVLPRLIWNALRRLKWGEGTPSWLPGTVAAVEAAFGGRDPAALIEAAPDTDANTAAALAGLPSAFVEGLALDMTLEAGAEGRLLIASLPDDGDIYLLIFCGLEDGSCALRRFMLISLLGE